MIETRIDALDFLAQLGDEVVFAYETAPGGDTITTIVTALLAMQLHVIPITLGAIQPIVTRSVKVEDQQDTILGVITKLRNTVGGYIEVDTNRQLNWWTDIGENKGQQIRYKKNIKGLSRTREYTNFGNRLYCYGAGEGSARIHLSDAIGMTEDYVEDIPSQGTYGMCIRQLTDKSITDPDVLLAWANLKLADMKAPRASYSVDMVNLVAMGWTFETLQLGSIVKVIDEDMGIDISARLVKIIRDLTDPGNIEVEISNVVLDFIDTSRGVYDTQQFYDHIATKIGAGQVVVLGHFVVSDWLTGGTTLIKGDFIRSGVIQSNNWGVGAGSYFDLVAGTFKLGGSAAPKLSWDGAILTVTGAIYATSGEFTGTLKVTNIEAGKTLTVNGIISAGGGAVKIDSAALKIYGAYLWFYSGATLVGNLNASSVTQFLMASNYDIMLMSGGTTRTIYLGPSGGSGVQIYNNVLFPDAATVDLGKSATRFNNVYCKILRPESSTSGGIILTQLAKAEEGGHKYEYNTGYLGTFTNGSWHWIA